MVSHRLWESISVIDQGWFIQRWSRELTWIDDMVIPCPLLHLDSLPPTPPQPIYNIPYPLPTAIMENPNSYLSFRSTHTRRIRSRTLQCSRLVAREWGSSWALCSSSRSSLGGSAKPCIFTSTSCKTYYQFIIFLSTWLYLLWIYILLS